MEATAGPMALQLPKTTTARTAEPKDRGTKRMPLVRIQWEEVNVESRNYDNLGQPANTNPLIL
jgi:hypothetical protein